MADIVQNTSYSNEEDRSPSSRYKKMKAALSQAFSTQTGGVTPQNIPTSPQPWERATQTVKGWGKTDQPVEGVPYAFPTRNEQVPQYEPQATYVDPVSGQQKTAYIPPNYPIFQGGGAYVAPSAEENLRLRNLPDTIGGQYLIDTQQPGKTLRSLRGVSPDFYKGGKYEYPSATSLRDYKNISGTRALNAWGDQIDHIVPLWLGGSDTDQNKQILNKFDHEKKTKIQAVPLTLLSAGLITENQAKMMALRWKDRMRDADIIPAVSSTGMITDANGNLDTAKALEIKKTWEDIDTQVRPRSGSWLKDWWGEMKNLKDFGQQTLGTGITGAATREFIKGFTSSATLGYVPYEFDDDYSSGAAKGVGVAAGLAGNVAGFLSGFGLFTKAAGFLSKGAANLMRLNKIAPSVENIAIKKLPVGEIMKISSKLRVQNAAKNTGLLIAYGQLGREGILGNLVTGEETEYGKRFLYDLTTGAMIGKFDNPGIRDAVKVGIGTTVLDLILSGRNPDIMNSTANGLMMGALHYAGGKNFVGGFRLRPEQTGMIKVFDDAMKKELAPLQRSAESIENEAGKAVAEAVKRYENPQTVKDRLESTSFDDIVNERAAIIMYNRTMYIKSLGLPEAEEAKLLASDYLSMLRYLYRHESASDQIAYAVRESEFIPTKTGKTMRDPLDQEAGEVRIIGVGTMANKQTTENLNYLAQQRAAGAEIDAYIYKRPTSDGIAMDALTGGKTPSPENFIEYYAVIRKPQGSPEVLKIGVAPTREKVDFLNSKRQGDLPEILIDKDQLAAKMGDQAIIPAEIEWMRGSKAVGASPKTPLEKGETASIVLRAKTVPDNGMQALNTAFKERQQARQIVDDLPAMEIDEIRASQPMVDYVIDNIRIIQGVIDRHSADQNVQAFVTAINNLYKGKGRMKTTPVMDELTAQEILSGKPMPVKEFLSRVLGKDRFHNFFVSSLVGKDAGGTTPRAKALWEEFMNVDIKTFGKTRQMIEQQAAVKKSPDTSISSQKTEQQTQQKEEAITLGGEDMGELPIARKGNVSDRSQGAAKPEPMEKKIKNAAKAIKVRINKKTPTGKEKWIKDPADRRYLDRIAQPKENWEPRVGSKETSVFDLAYRQTTGTERKVNELAEYPDHTKVAAVNFLKAFKRANNEEATMDTFLKSGDIKGKSEMIKKTVALMRDEGNMLDVDLALEYLLKIQDITKNSPITRSGVAAKYIGGEKLSPLTNVAVTPVASKSGKKYPALFSGNQRLYPRSETTQKFIENADRAWKKIAKKDTENLTYDEISSYTFIEGLKRLRSASGEKRPVDLSRLPFFEGFISQWGKSLSGTRMRNSGKPSSEKVSNLVARAKQEQERVGEMPREDRDKLYGKTLDERQTIKDTIARSRSAKEIETRQEQALEAIGDGEYLADVRYGGKGEKQKPTIGVGASAEEMRTFGSTAVPTSGEVELSPLEYQYLGKALQAAGLKPDASRGVKDGLLMVRNYVAFVNRYQKTGAEKQRFDTTIQHKIEKELRSIVDRAYQNGGKKAIEKKEQKRIVDATLLKTSPTGTEVKDPRNGSYVVPPSPRIFIREMIEKYDGADPERSKKIIETIAKKRGYTTSVDGTLVNKRYERLLNASQTTKVPK